MKDRRKEALSTALGNIKRQGRRSRISSLLGDDEEDRGGTMVSVSFGQPRRRDDDEDEEA